MAFLQKRIPLPTQIFLLNHLRVMARAGIPMATALNVLGAHFERKYRADFVKICATIERGVSLADAFAAHPGFLPSLAVELIRTGEASGTLEETLAEISTQLRKEYEFKTRLRGALLYPTIVIVAMAAIGVLVVTYVLPRLAELFEGVAELPLPTRTLLAIAHFSEVYGVPILASSLIGAAIIIGYARSRRGRPKWDQLILRLGPIGHLVREIHLVRFARTLGGLLKADMPMVKSLELTAGTSGNDAYRYALITAAASMSRGGTLEQALRKFSTLFPPTALQLVGVGEATGKLDALLIELADFYESDLDRTLQNLTTIIEPILILIIGIAVAFLAVAILLPLYSIAQVI
ncbi:MAG: type II secretion system F family protein [Candidatus Uhrbacteria bacterium]